MPESGDALFTNAASAVAGTHDIILNRLDSWRPYKNGDGTVDNLFYGSDVFEGTERDWESVPVILGKRHPSTPYMQNPAKALEESEGVVVGNLSEVEITKNGTPVLRSKLHLTEGNAETLLKTRKMALSTGFISGKREGKLTGINGKISPDHVLLFWHNRNNAPQDMASMFLNSTEEGTMPEDESIKKVLTEFLAELKSLIVPAKADVPMMPEKPEPKIVVTNMTDEINEMKAVIEEQKAMIANMSAEIDAFKKADEERAKKAIEDKWTLVKNSIPPGLYSTPDLESTARKEWETDPTAFFLKNNSSKKEETTKDGVEYVTNSTDNVDDSEKAYLELLELTGGVRR